MQFTLGRFGGQEFAQCEDLVPLLQLSPLKQKGPLLILELAVLIGIPE